MECKEIRDGELIEKYVAGRLSTDLTEALESHYFGCDECAQRLREARILNTALKEKAAGIRAEARPPRRTRSVWAPALAIAAALVLAAVLFWPRGTTIVPANQQANAADFSLLAKVAPPPYKALVLRGSEAPSEAAFEAAMQNYTTGDFAGAARALRPIVAADPEGAEPHFYLAASELLAGEAQPAIRTFAEVIRLGDPRYVEESHFLTAKAWLQLRRPAEAEAELLPLSAGNGERAAEARKLLKNLRILRDR
jgi:anti-sigma factor RsiW